MLASARYPLPRHLSTFEAMHELPTDDAGSRPRADAARNRLRVLAVAERLYAERGAGRVSMDDVAAAAGLGKGTVYRAVGDRAGLAFALLDARERDLQEAVLRGAPPPLGPGAPPEERARAPSWRPSRRSRSTTRSCSPPCRAGAAPTSEHPVHAWRHAHLRAQLAAARAPTRMPTGSRARSSPRSAPSTCSTCTGAGSTGRASSASRATSSDPSEHPPRRRPCGSGGIRRTLADMSLAADLAARLRDRIEQGELQPGERLPPVRELAATEHVAPSVAGKASRSSSARGASSAGSAAAPTWHAAARPAAPSSTSARTGGRRRSRRRSTCRSASAAAARPGSVNLSAGLPLVDPEIATAVGKELEAVVREAGAGLFGYGAPRGDVGLRELVAATSAPARARGRTRATRLVT